MRIKRLCFSALTVHTFLIDISLGFMVVPLFLKNCHNCGVSSVSFLCCAYHNSTVAGQNVFLGGGADLAE